MIDNIQIEQKKDDGAPEDKPSRNLFPDRDTRFTKLIKGHYLKNNLFFFASVLCAIVADSQEHCVIMIFLVLLLRTAQLFGLFFGFLWLSYAMDLIVVAFNYTHIFTAIAYFSK